MALQSINLYRGEKLNFEILGQTSGEATPIENGWTVGCYLTSACGCEDQINLSPVIANGVATVSFDTASLILPAYQIHISINDGTGLVPAPRVNLYIANP